MPEGLGGASCNCCSGRNSRAISIQFRAGRMLVTIVMIVFLPMVRPFRAASFRTSFDLPFFLGRSRFASSLTLMNGTPSAPTSSDAGNPKRIAVVGGGLAGLATTAHLLDGSSRPIQVTIFDRAQVGTGGASAVAGGFLHPLSPSGKLVYLGIEGLVSTNNLVEKASRFEDQIVIRNEIYRVVVDEEKVSALRKTANELPHVCEYLDRGQLESQRGKVSGARVLGALRLYGGCKVVHLPTYLKGLWSYCASQSASWVQDAKFEHFCQDDWAEYLSGFDSVVFSAGSGLFKDLRFPCASHGVTLVRGRSMEIAMDDGYGLADAILCGKYVSPLPRTGTVLIGATHEFRDEPMTESDLTEKLKALTYGFASEVWDHGTPYKVTSGVRVQSKRTENGRLPVVAPLKTEIHENAFIYTGLSSRGLLYHSVFGKGMADMVLASLQEDNASRS